jgi:hypothetical protein
MEGVLNQSDFISPRRELWLNQAMGWEKENGPHSGGLRDPREVKVRRGSGLFRIGHSKDVRTGLPRADASNLANPWWMDGETFGDIAISADTIGTDRQYMARLKLSVSEHNGLFDLIYWVRVRESLGSFMGFGHPVYDEADTQFPNPPPAWGWPGREVRQCFIPGLRDLNKQPTGLADQAFEVITGRPIPVHAWSTIDNGVLKNLG